MREIRITPDLSFTSLAMGDSKRGLPENEENAFRLMDLFWENGGNTFDSARGYADGGADRAMGKWIRSRRIDRDAVRLVTKGSHPLFATMHISRLSKEEIEQDINESLAFMGVLYSDIHYLHRDDIKLPIEAIIPILCGLVTSGKTRAIGLSNWTASRIIEANIFCNENGLPPISSSQILYGLAQTTAPTSGDVTHIIMNDVEKGFYRETQLPLMAFGTQARGWFHARANGEEPKASPKKFYDALPENRRRLIRLEKLCQAKNLPMGAVLNAYAHDSGCNTIVLTSFSNAAQVEEALLGETIRLSDAEVRYLETGVGSCE